MISKIFFLTFRKQRIRGSVVYKFLKQIKEKENITVTGKSVSRFFISIQKAVERISEAFQLMQGGEVFVVMNMSSFKIIDLAKAIRSILLKKNYNFLN